jgi:hypothetical protein
MISVPTKLLPGPDVVTVDAKVGDVKQFDKLTRGDKMGKGRKGGAKSGK